MELTKTNALETLESESNERKQRCENLVITLENVKQCEAVRTSNNKFIKEAREGINQIKETYLKPLNARLAPYEAFLDELETSNKDLSKRLLETNKERFRQSLEREFDEWGFENENGEVPSFEEMYDPSWASKTKAEARGLLLKKLNKWKEKDNKKQVCIIFDGTESEIESIRKWLKLNDIEAEITY